MSVIDQHYLKTHLRASLGSLAHQHFVEGWKAAKAHSRKSKKEPKRDYFMQDIMAGHGHLQQ